MLPKSTREGQHSSPLPGVPFVGVHHEKRGELFVQKKEGAFIVNLLKIITTFSFLSFYHVNSCSSLDQLQNWSREQVILLTLYMKREEIKVQGSSASYIQTIFQQLRVVF